MLLRINHQADSRVLSSLRRQGPWPWTKQTRGRLRAYASRQGHFIFVHQESLAAVIDTWKFGHSSSRILDSQRLSEAFTSSSDPEEQTKLRSWEIAPMLIWTQDTFLIITALLRLPKSIDEANMAKWWFIPAENMAECQFDEVYTNAKAGLTVEAIRARRMAHKRPVPGTSQHRLQGYPLLTRTIHLICKCQSNFFAHLSQGTTQLPGCFIILLGESFWSHISRAIEVIVYQAFGKENRETSWTLLLLLCK